MIWRRQLHQTGEHSQSDLKEGHSLTLSRKEERGRTNETLYVWMLKEEAQMALRYNVTASAANWALLAGYLVIPGTFTSLQKSSHVEEALDKNGAGRTVMRAIQNPPLLAIACLFFAGATSAFVWLLHHQRLRRNYLWLINRLFM